MVAESDEADECQIVTEFDKLDSKTIYQMAYAADEADGMEDEYSDEEEYQDNLKKEN